MPPTATPNAPARGRPGRPPGPDRRRPERLERILEAACRAILDRGFPATRIADVAEAAGVSTGTVHYYFATKDEVLVAALKWASGRLFARIERPGDDSAPRRLARLLAVSVPYPGPARDEACSEQWRGYFHDVVRSGIDAGDFHPAAPAGEVAERLVAFVDGLGFETALGYRWTSPQRMHARLVEFAAEQLGVDPATLAGREERA
jgi:AcrR family transcriptional regulator